MRTYVVRILLAGLTAVLAINLWTGAPIFAIWVGSRVQKGTGLLEQVTPLPRDMHCDRQAIQPLDLQLFHCEVGHVNSCGRAAPPDMASAGPCRGLRDRRNRRVSSAPT